MATAYDIVNDTSNKITDRSRKDAAYNALRAAYGDIAGDSAAAGQLQQQSQSAQMFPSALAKEQASTADTQAQADQRKQAAQAAAGLRAVNLLKATAQKGGDLGATFDKLTPTLPALGVDPAHIAPLREFIISNPDKLDAIAASLQPKAAVTTPERYQAQQLSGGGIVRVPLTGDSAAAQEVTLNGQPVQGYQAPQAQARIDQGTARLEQQRALAQPEFKGAVTEAQAVGKARGTTTAADLPLSKTARAKALIGLHTAQTEFDNLESNIDSAVTETGSFSAGPLARTAFVGGTPAANLKARLTTVASNNVLSVITQLKEMSKTGSTGFGQLSDREGQLIQSKLAAVDQSTSPAFLKKALGDLKAQVSKSRARVEEAYRADLEARGETTPARIRLKWNPEKGVAEGVTE